MQKLLSGILLLLFGCGVSSANPLTLVVSPNQPQFTVVLPANPTTGYQWALQKYDKNLLELSGSQYLPPNNRLMGAGGKMKFNFKILSKKIYPVSTSLWFKYARPWENQGGTLKQVIIKFQTASAVKRS